MEEYKGKLENLKSILNKKIKKNDQNLNDNIKEEKIINVEEFIPKYNQIEIKNIIASHHLNNDIFLLFLKSFLFLYEIEFKKYGHDLGKDLNSEVINIIMKDDENLVEKLSYYLFMNSVSEYNERLAEKNFIFDFLQKENINTYEYISCMEKVNYNDMERP